MRTAVLCLGLAFAPAANGQNALQWSGFALLRGATETDTGPLEHEQLSAQLQLGLDWTPSPMFGAHVHLLGRSDEDGSRRGTLGVPEAWLELNLRPRGDRLRIRGGAFFLPTSRENIDALWENPYAITSSALNSWFGEELRPIGIDASYFRKRAFAGATIFRGNDTFGALPPVRGWTLDDHWTLLGEWVPVDELDFTSVSAENDDRLGWAARGGWNGERLFVQVTHVDNRSDGLDYDRLFNWGTYFTVVGAEYVVNDWTIAGETGWGPTFLVVEGNKYTNDLSASYVMASRRWGRSRATVRLESFASTSNDSRRTRSTRTIATRSRWRTSGHRRASCGSARKCRSPRETAARWWRRGIGFPVVDSIRVELAYTGRRCFGKSSSLSCSLCPLPRMRRR